MRTGSSVSGQCRNDDRVNDGIREEGHGVSNYLIPGPRSRSGFGEKHLV